jgi:hypothetical protein
LEAEISRKVNKKMDMFRIKKDQNNANFLIKALVLKNNKKSIPSNGDIIVQSNIKQKIKNG